MNDETRNVIAGALEILADEENWTKDSEYRELASGVQSCLWGAFKRAVLPGYYRYQDDRYQDDFLCAQGRFYQVQQLTEAAACEVGRIIAEQYPDRLSNGIHPRAEGDAAIIPFNDHPDTVHSEVIAVLEKALAK